MGHQLGALTLRQQQQQQQQQQQRGWICGLQLELHTAAAEAKEQCMDAALLLVYM